MAVESATSLNSSKNRATGLCCANPQTEANRAGAEVGRGEQLAAAPQAGLEPFSILGRRLGGADLDLVQNLAPQGVVGVVPVAVDAHCQKTRLLMGHLHRHARQARLPHAALAIDDGVLPGRLHGLDDAEQLVVAPGK